ncbi:MAG: SGNH/GDSL hydrolase family protein [Clostridia bacterium]|nr:SGNH/GDSL hydrolase family protein [Clostridia bacterium]
MELRNKIINFLGDSITAGSGVTGPEKRFGNLIEARCGLLRGNNYGIGGTRIAAQKLAPGEMDFGGDFCLRCKDMDPEADINIVFGGTNDYGHGNAPIGTPDDRTPETFWGACHYLCRTLLEKYPNAVSVICIPLHRLCEDTPSGNTGYTLSQYNDIIRQVAEYYSLPVLDLWKISGMQPEVDVIRERYMPDGLHPNDAGHVLLADRMIAFLSAL